MHSLFGDRFMRLFGGNLQRRLKRTISNDQDQNPEAKAEGVGEPVDPAYEEGHEKILAEGNLLPNDEMSEIG